MATPVTSVSLVKGILGPKYSSRIALPPFLRTAAVLMARVLACATAKGITIDDDTFQEMETYLAAHFYNQADSDYTSRSTLSASGAFEGKTDMGLANSRFGQQAMLLDPSGCLALFNQVKQRGSFVWLGKPKRDETSYDDRNN